MDSHIPMKHRCNSDGEVSALSSSTYRRGAYDRGTYLRATNNRRG